MALITKQELDKLGKKALTQTSTQQAIQQALIERVTEYIAQYTPQPRIISYKPNASGDLMGKFESQGRVFTFRLSTKGLVYKPFVQRKDNESDDDYAQRFDSGSELWLEYYRTDAAKAFKPKPSVRVPAVKKERGTKANPNCSAVSYHCGVCISLGKNCIKNATTAALKERLSKINSLSRMAAKGQPVPQVKTGVIGAKNDPKSLKRKINDFVQKQAGGKKSTSPKAKVATPDKKTSIANSSDDIPTRLKTIDSQKAALVKKMQSITANKYDHQITKADKKASAKLSDQINALDNKKSDILKAESSRLAKTIESYPVADASNIKIGSTIAVMRSGELARATITEINNREGGHIYGIVNANHSNRGTSEQYKKGETDEGLLFRLGDGKARVVPNDFNPSGTPTTRDRQAAQRAAAEPNKTTTLATPLPLTAQAMKRMERGESISDNDTYHVKKEGNKFRVTDPSRFEDKGKLVDKAGLAAHMKELEAQPRAVKKSSSMNPVIPINSNPDTMLRALRDGRLVGDAKQGYEIQQRGAEYLITTMPNKNGDYSGVMNRKELVAFVKGGGDASRFNKATDKPQYSPDVQEFITAGERRVKKLSQDLAFFKKEGKPRKVKETQQLLDIQTKDLAALKKRTLDVDQKREEESNSRQSQKDAEIKSLVSVKPSVDPESIKARYANKAEEVGVLKAFDGLTENSPLHGESLYKRIKRDFSDKAKELGLGNITDGYANFQQPLKSLESKGWIAKVPSLGWNVSDGAIQTGLPMGGFSNGSTIKRSEVAPRKNEDPQGFSYVLTDAGKKALALTKNAPKPEPSNPIPLTSGKNLTPSQKKQSRTADQVAIDRTKNDVGNATKRINDLDANIKKLKAGGGMMSEADIKKVTQLERQKSEWETKRAGHQAKLEGLSKGKEKNLKTMLKDGIDRASSIAKGKPVNERTNKEISDARAEIVKDLPPKHEMTLGDWMPFGVAVQKQSDGGSNGEYGAKFEHKWAVENALKNGVTVPDEVLKDYPDLKASKPAPEPRLTQTDLFGNPVAIPESEPVVTVKAKPKAKASSKVDVFTPEMKSFAEKVLKGAEKGVTSLGLNDSEAYAFKNRFYQNLPDKYVTRVPAKITEKGEQYFKENKNKYSQDEVSQAKLDLDKANSLEYKARNTSSRTEKAKLREESEKLRRKAFPILEDAKYVNALAEKQGASRPFPMTYSSSGYKEGHVSSPTVELNKEGLAMQKKIADSKLDKPITIDLTQFGGGKYEVKPTPEAIKTFREVLAKAKTQTDANFKSSGGGLSKATEKEYDRALAEGTIDKATYELLTGNKRKDSADLYRVRIPNSILVSRTDACGCDNNADRVLSYITDTSGNMMGICQIRGIKYRFLKPVIGETILTPVSATNLGYLFDMAPDLSLRDDDPFKGIFTPFFNPFNKALTSR